MTGNKSWTAGTTRKIDWKSKTSGNCLVKKEKKEKNNNKMATEAEGKKESATWHLKNEAMVIIGITCYTLIRGQPGLIKGIWTAYQGRVSPKYHLSLRVWKAPPQNCGWKAREPNKCLSMLSLRSNAQIQRLSQRAPHVLFCLLPSKKEIFIFIGFDCCRVRLKRFYSDFDPWNFSRYVVIVAVDFHFLVKCCFFYSYYSANPRKESLKFWNNPEWMNGGGEGGGRGHRSSSALWSAVIAVITTDISWFWVVFFEVGFLIFIFFSPFLLVVSFYGFSVWWHPEDSHFSLSFFSGLGYFITRHLLHLFSRFITSAHSTGLKWFNLATMETWLLWITWYLINYYSDSVYN